MVKRWNQEQRNTDEIGDLKLPLEMMKWYENSTKSRCDTGNQGCYVHAVDVSVAWPRLSARGADNQPLLSAADSAKAGQYGPVRHFVAFCKPQNATSHMAFVGVCSPKIPMVCRCILETSLIFTWFGDQLGDPRRDSCCPWWWTSGWWPSIWRVRPSIWLSGCWTDVGWILGGS